MSRDKCDKSAQDILDLFFFPQHVMAYSVGQFLPDGDWEKLESLVDTWWGAYKDWERQDKLATAFGEQRLTVKGTRSGCREREDTGAYPGECPAG